MTSDKRLLLACLVAVHQRLLLPLAPALWVPVATHAFISITMATMATMNGCVDVITRHVTAAAAGPLMTRRITGWTFYRRRRTVNVTSAWWRPEWSFTTIGRARRKTSVKHINDCSKLSTSSQSSPNNTRNRLNVTLEGWLSEEQGLEKDKCTVW